MARKRDPRRDEAFEIWKQLNGEITNRALAERLDVPEKTISAWKSRDKWNAVLQKNNCSTTNQKTIKKARAPNGKKQNRSGNPNPKNQFAKRNQAAVKHGLFSKYIPQETLELMGMLDEKSPADLIWDQIQIQYAAIIRAQRIMYVNDKDEMIKELKKEKFEIVPTKDGMKQMTTEVEYEFQFAWDRHATFLNAQSRAMSELRSLIKQFNGMAHEDDERRLKLEMMQANLDKTNAEIDRLTDDGDDDAPIEIVIKRKGDES